MINADAMTIDDIENLAEHYCSECWHSCDSCWVKDFVNTLYSEIEVYNKSHS